jgi:beta-lactamase regulating signal transducer with metallopeptidase domain
MHLLTLEEWITTVLVKALGWTFAHSIWQALIAVLAAYAMLAVMKRAKASARYNMLLAVSTLFIFVVIITFIYQLRQNQIAEETTGSQITLQILYDHNSAANPVILESKRLLDILFNYFNQHLPLFVAVWFIIFCVKWLRLSLNLSYVSRISRFESAAVSDEWQQFSNKLKTDLGIRQQVKLLHSNIVKVPLVSGIFKPLILVPAGMLSNMPADVIESILLHELAHIKRNDYLVNVIQSAAETIFFFNPFTLKLSALIREEREACCDAIAINATQNKVSYVQALVTFGEYSSTSAPLLAFAGSKNHLLQRVKRILYNQNKKPGFMEKSILLSSVIMLSVITAFTSIANEKKPVPPVSGEVKTFVRDTVPDNVNENEEVNVDEKEIETRDEPSKDEPSKAENKQRQKNKREVERRMEKNQKELEKIQQKLAEIQVNVNNDVQLKNEKVQKQIIELQSKVNLQNQKIHLDQQLQLAQVDKAMRNINMEKINRDVQQALAAIDMEKLNRETQAATLRALESTKQFDGLTFRSGYMDDAIASILEFLEKNDVGSAKDVKSFTLNNDELTVNGKKQPSALHQQLKEKYIRDKNDHIIYSNSNGTKSITIQQNDTN